MGSDEYQDNEKPRHPVYLDAFYIDIHETKIDEYRKYGPLPPIVSDYQLEADQPIVDITWDQARNYCIWAKKRLPTEAEWEKAARGTDERMYPWGKGEPTRSLTNFDNGDKFDKDKLWPTNSLNDGQSPYGILHMAGNVWEWVEDWYQQSYYIDASKRNSVGPFGHGRHHKVLRGGSWDNKDDRIRSTNRQFWREREFKASTVGFRCAKDFYGMAEEFFSADDFQSLS
jgi:formylglycine-generating enzyme required for sulfatase activity